MPRRQLVYVGTYSEPILFGTGQVLQGQGKGIYCFEFDAANGALVPVGITENVRNSSYLAFDPARKFLYCVNEFKEYEGKASGAVSAFRIDPETGALTYLNTTASHGTDPCHLVVDATGRNVLVANFASGSVCVLPVRDDGSLGDSCEFIQHQGSSIDPRRQAGPHAHAVTLDRGNRFLFVPDLGMDKVINYAFDAGTGKLTPNPRQPWIATKPGAGPRQIVMHPKGRFAYLINELDSTMTAYAYDAETGVLTDLQTLPTLPAGFTGHSTCAEVQIAPSGRFLYGSNRGHDSIVIYAIDEASGTLTLVGHESTRGKIPRNFEISPTGEHLAAANQDSNNVVMFRVDTATGKLTATGNVVEAGTPICVRFM
ncbi:lactonase family protein [Alsobacter sp. SYSU M60028]|uniref:Lactonase family protein n=1 Tax=Alsobacter ponti TaxID=2962936 RepID=A0ABT1LAR1_9HYPH|nr:lactonase family protein [Alsobacter ponti]MCP8938557.1 lactonase family protein [Alsobacter ponti]